MKSKTLLTHLCFAVMLVCLTFSGNIKAQQTLLWGTSPFQDSLWAIDTTSWQVAVRLAPTLSGFTITGITGMAYDPCDHETYVIMKVSGVTGRVLGKIDLYTGVCTQVGNLGDNFSSISFRADGQLFGVTGDGASTPETLYMIDKTNGTKTLASILGNGADGEIICYNRDDNHFYHWSGNTTVIYEKVLAVSPYTVTNIPITGTPNGETFGAIYIGNSTFIISTINSSFNKITSTGTWGGQIGNNPDDLRGLVMPPVFTLEEDTVCFGDTIRWIYSGYTTDTVIYHWGDGNSDTLFSAGSAVHVYSSNGNYTSYAVLMNMCNSADTMAMGNIRINALPVVGITPGDTAICSGDSILLTGSSGGSSQWFMNGSMISGATTNTYVATAAGFYNMVKTNQNGCADSAATGTAVVILAQPSANFGHVVTGDSVSFADSSVSVTSWSWDFGDGATSNLQNPSHNYTACGSYNVCLIASSCNASDTSCKTVDVVIPPTAAFSMVTVNLTTNFTNNTTGTGNLSYSWDFGDGGNSTQPNPSHTYATGGNYTVCLYVTDSCGSDTLCQQTGILTGISNESILQSFELYPNPAGEMVILKGMLVNGNEVKIAVTDLLGREMISTADYFGGGSFHTELNVSNLPAGTYLVNVSSGSETVHFRMVKE